MAGKTEFEWTRQWKHPVSGNLNRTKCTIDFNEMTQTSCEKHANALFACRGDNRCGGAVVALYSEPPARPGLLANAVRAVETYARIATAAT